MRREIVRGRDEFHDERSQLRGRETKCMQCDEAEIHGDQLVLAEYLSNNISATFQGSRNSVRFSGFQG